MKKEEVVCVGPGLQWILTIIFIVLKLTGNITWGWIWVFSPIWIPLAIIFGVIVIIFIFFSIYDFISRRFYG